MLKVKTLIVLLLISCYSLNAQESIPLHKIIENKIYSDHLQEDRTISVYLPQNYDLSKSKFPVIYILDGKTHIDHVIGAVTFLANQGIIPQLVIVAVHNIDRSRDFSPVHSEQIPTSGGAETFLAFLNNELTIFMNKNYRISDFSVLIGHSFGGTFATYSLLEKPNLFDAYISISPFLQYVDDHLVKQAKEKLKQSYENKIFYYMTVGNEPNYFKPLETFSSLVKEISSKDIMFDYKKFETENHATIPYLSVFNGLKFIFSDWPLTQEILTKGLEEVDKHYKTVSKKYGLGIQTPENIINLLGYRYLQNNDSKNAIIIFSENTKRYPNSANVYDSLGEAYETDNQLDLAEINYKKAYDLGVKNKDANIEIFKKNMNRVKKK